MCVNVRLFTQMDLSAEQQMQMMAQFEVYTERKSDGGGPEGKEKGDGCISKQEWDDYQARTRARVLHMSHIYVLLSTPIYLPPCDYFLFESLPMREYSKRKELIKHTHTHIIL